VTTSRFYERSSLFVTAYDALHLTDMGGTRVGGDVEFYRELAAEQGGPILELACGTGRVAIPLAAAGFDVVGLDLSSPMLEIGRSKQRAAPSPVSSRLTFVHGDMRDFDLGRTFPLAVIAFRSFASLLTVDDQRLCLTAIRRHLEPQGLLAVNVFDPRLDLCVPDPPGDYPHTRGQAGLAGGNSVEVVVTERRNDPLRQILAETWQVTERRPDGGIEGQEWEELVLRWTYRYELYHLLELSGFGVVAEYSDFAKSPPAYGGELVIVARRTDP
jgi:ubiquinone/menaquinone biosynthesis C-methylase UbiE